MGAKPFVRPHVFAVGVLKGSVGVVVVIEGGCLVATVIILAVRVGCVLAGAVNIMTVVIIIGGFIELVVSVVQRFEFFDVVVVVVRALRSSLAMDIVTLLETLEQVDSSKVK